ncbi:hypothetical protein IJH89_01330 [Candidatus Saccharibacteria bacterium]|nr:hypothetical protein [Candidatus Saccharibacteria bacterium]
MILRDKWLIEEMNGGMVVIKVQTVIPIEILTQEIPDIDHVWKIELAEFQVENIADDIIEEIKRTLGKYIFISMFGEEEKDAN